MGFGKSMARFALHTAILSLSAVGCAGERFTIKNVPSGPYDEANGKAIHAEASGFQLFSFIPIATNSRHARAWRRLERLAYGDFITDVKIQDSWTYAVVGTVYTVNMEATAYPYVEE